MTYNPWMTSREMMEHLGVSYRHLQRLRVEDFKEGKHYRNIARRNAARPTYQYHRERIDEYLNQQAGRR